MCMLYGYGDKAGFLSFLFDKQTFVVDNAQIVDLRKTIKGRLPEKV